MSVDARSGGLFIGRIVLALFTLWALAMILPDLQRLHKPLGSFGFYANNDGLVTDVQGPFRDAAASPAFAAGLRAGDRLDLTPMRWRPIDTLQCASARAAWGGMRLVRDQERAELILAVPPDKPARQIDIVARPRPYNRWVLAVLLLDQIAAFLVI